MEGERVSTIIIIIIGMENNSDSRTHAVSVNTQVVSVGSGGRVSTNIIIITGMDGIIVTQDTRGVM